MGLKRHWFDQVKQVLSSTTPTIGDDCVQLDKSRREEMADGDWWVDSLLVSLAAALWGVT